MSHRVLPGIGNWVQRGFRIWPALRRAISVIAGVNSKAGSSVYRLARIGGMLAVFGGAHLQGEIIVSEVMFDTGSDESRWEWVELYNRGTTDIDLDGYYINRLGSAANAPTATPHIRATNGGATIVPAGGVAVVFDGQALGFDGARFRQAWELDANVRLIGAASFPTLTNSGTAFGFWSSIDDQLEDTEFDPVSER